MTGKPRMKAETEISETAWMLQEEFGIGETAARAMAVHWDLLAGKRFFEADDSSIIAETEQFLANLSADAADAEMKVKRKKMSADRSAAKKKQLNIFSGDSETPDTQP